MKHMQRQIMQLRVDYLSQLNTQTMLIAGSAVACLSSLELEAPTSSTDSL